MHSPNNDAAPRYSLKGEYALWKETQRLEQQARKEGWSEERRLQEHKNAVDRIYEEFYVKQPVECSQQPASRDTASCQDQFTDQAEGGHPQYRESAVSDALQSRPANIVKKLFLHTIALLLGAAAFVAAFGVVTIAIRFLGSIPLIGSLLYYPSGTAWALVVLPPSAACFAAVWLACKISGSSRPMAAVMVLFWLANIVAIFLLHNFTWRELLQSITGIICAGIFLFQDQENALN